MRNFKLKKFYNPKTPNNIKLLKNTYLNWIKSEIENDYDDYFSITLHLNPFNKFIIEKDRYKDVKGIVKNDDIRLDMWRKSFDGECYVEWGSKNKYSKNIKYFLNKLSDEIWGNNWNRRNGGFEFVVGFFESKMEYYMDRRRNKSNHNPHYHLVIKKPKTISEIKFRSLIIKLWGFWNFKFNKKYFRRSGVYRKYGWKNDSWMEKDEYKRNYGMVDDVMSGGVFSHINIQNFYRKDDGFDFIDYGFKYFSERDNKIDLRNCILKRRIK